jgi:hypothetical protein
MRRPSLPLDLPRQRTKREAIDVWHDVQRLRELGFRVLRSGNEHCTIDGKRVHVKKLPAWIETAEKKLKEAERASY